MPPLRPPTAQGAPSGMQEPLLGSSGATQNAGEDPRGYGMRIVSQLERDLASLENIAAKMNTDTDKSGPITRALDEAPKKGKVAPLAPPPAAYEPYDAECGMPSPMRGGHCGGYNFIVSIPLPSVCEDAENAAFEKKYLRNDHTFEEVVRHAIIPPSSRKAAVIDGEIRHLRDARHTVIELLLSFFDSLSASLVGASAGVEVFKFTSEDCEELFVCVKISDNLAETLAQMGDYSVQLAASDNCLDKLHVKISDKANMIPAFVNYDHHMQEDGLVKMHEKSHKPGEFTLLRSVDSMRLLYDKITDYIDLHELKRMGLISTVYLGHNKDNLVFFHTHWSSFRKILWPAQPIDEIRDYFGEGVAFYFLFLGFLAKGLLVVSSGSYVLSRMVTSLPRRSTMYLLPLHHRMVHSLAEVVETPRGSLRQ